MGNQHALHLHALSCLVILAKVPIKQLSQERIRQGGALPRVPTA